MHIFLRKIIHQNFRLLPLRRTASNSAKWSSNRVRRTFIDYFVSQGCTFVPSSSVIPSAEDQSLLYVNAGMNQFKPVFLGTLDPSDQRSHLRLAVNSQKCIRVGGKHNDLAAVGRDGTHHTFFEMLGNWAFNGQLQKKAACQQALTLLTEIYGLPKERLFITYFKGDEQLGVAADLECREAWRELGFSDDRILPLGIGDNFWEMRASDGPCGPCTEILYSYADPPSASESLEIWNLVFISFQKHEGGRLTPLPAMHVDTGMGLERLCSVLQGVKTTYETDVFQPLLKFIQKQTGANEYTSLFGDNDATGIDTSYRLLADHARMFTVALADGAKPAATKSGFILRRIIRTAAYQALTMRAKVARKKRGKVDLADLSSVVADSLGDAYPELRSNLGKIREVVAEEQADFEDMFQRGKYRLGVLLATKKEQVSTPELLRVQSWYSFPIEELRLMAKRKGITLDEEELQELWEERKSNKAALWRPAEENAVSGIRGKVES